MAQDYKLPLGIIPVGSGNSLSRDLIDGGAPLTDFIRLIAGGTTRSMDIARVKTKEETFYYANMMGFGFIADVNKTATKLKALKAHAYTLGVLYRTIPLKTINLRMIVDGRELQMRNVFVIISNSRYTGGDYLIAPKAKLDDAKLDLIILNKLSRINLLKTFPKIFDGSHIHTPFVDYIQASEIKLEADTPVDLSPDGEVLGQFPAEVSCMPGAVEVFG
jgi:diacylglycerol kinase (ATP)